jgi:hypothetical protein
MLGTRTLIADEQALAGSCLALAAAPLQRFT